MEQRNDTQLVYIKDLLFTVLYRWNAVVTVALVFALLLGGLGFCLTNGDPTQEELQKLASYSTSAAVLDQRIQALEKSISERQAHLRGSLLMQLDPYNHYEAQLTVSVQLPESDDGLVSAFGAQAILEAYRSLVTEESCLARLAEILQQPAQYVPELIASTVPAMGTDTMTFTVKCADAQTASALAEAMEAHLVQYQAQLVNDLAPHSLSVLKSTAFAVADSALAEEQRAETNRISDILTGLTEARNKRNALARPAVTGTATRLKTALLLTVLGAFAGVFVTVCLLWAGHIGSDRVYSSRTLRNRTGIKLLGCLDSGSKRSRLQTWLRKLEGRKLSADPTVTATDISLRTEADRLLVTGSEASCNALAAALRKAMPQAQIVVAGDLLTCPDALKALAASQAVVLVETCGESRYSAIAEKLEKIADHNKQLIGCVLVDG